LTKRSNFAGHIFVDLTINCLYLVLPNSKTAEKSITKYHDLSATWTFSEHGGAYVCFGVPYGPLRGGGGKDGAAGIYSFHAENSLYYRKII
jgi:hypothetical protein